MHRLDREKTNVYRQLENLGPAVFTLFPRQIHGMQQALFAAEYVDL